VAGHSQPQKEADLLRLVQALVGDDFLGVHIGCDLRVSLL
jgi:hypothetical protein